MSNMTNPRWISQSELSMPPNRGPAKSSAAPEHHGHFVYVEMLLWGTL